MTRRKPERRKKPEQPIGEFESRCRARLGWLHASVRSAVLGWNASHDIAEALNVESTGRSIRIAPDRVEWHTIDSIAALLGVSRAWLCDPKIPIGAELTLPPPPWLRQRRTAA